MTQCVKCHTSLPGHSRFCFACGADQTGGGVDAQPSGPVEVLQARMQRLVQGQYEIKRLLGKGGMGAVFLAHDLTLDREVAIKVLPPDFSTDPQVIKRFQQEARMAAKLDHPNIIPIYRVESEEGVNYFIMKYISGTTLEDVLESKQPLSYDYVQRILWEAACALGHAHSRGVVHRDVKPANIMFDHDGRVMLTDFGISKALQSAGGLTGTGMIIGTPHYMAPEQAKGQPVDGRADQYSLGVVGYRMLAGSLPFSGDSVHTILYKHIFEEAPRVSGLRQDIPRYLSDAIQRALAKEPGQRFASMEEFATAVWPEQPVTATGKVTPRPAVRGARGPVTADTPTEQVATAAARTTPMPQAAGGRPRPGLTAPPTHPRASPPSRKSSSRAGVLVFLGVLVAAAGGYIVMRGSGEGEPGSSTGAGAAPAPPNLATPGVASAQSTAVGVSRSETTATAAASSSAVVTPPAAQPAPPSAPRQPGPQPTRRPARQTPAAKQPVVQAPPVVEPPPAQPVAPEGYLTIDADPFGTVFVDGVNVGTTPVVRHVVKPGAHQIRIESPGYKTVVDRVTVDSGNTVRRRYPLTPEG